MRSRSFSFLNTIFKAAKQAKEDDEIIEKDKVVVDLSQMSETEKKNLLKKESPELLTYIEDYKRKIVHF